MTDTNSQSKQKVSGWGRNSHRACNVNAGPGSDLRASILNDQAIDSRGTCIRGEGRGYGDCATNGGGVLWRLEENFIEIDEKTGVARCGGGARLSDLYKAGALQHLVPPVVPGTKEVSIGGMLASDIHGKNHHVSGSIANHVQRIKLLDGMGEILVLDRTDERFWATMGGMGLTGAILEADILMERIQSPFIKTKTRRAGNFQDLAEQMNEADNDTFSVAWVDLSNKLGRGVVSSGNWEDFDTPWPKELFKKTRRVPNLNVNFINQATVRTFNEAWWQKARLDEKSERSSIAEFFHPLDGVGEWNVLYGKKGFFQYQFVVGDGNFDVLNQIVFDMIKKKLGSPMVVLKRFGEGNSGHLSFPMRGWTLAVDFHAGAEKIIDTIWNYDDKITECGGRVYLAKDSCLRPENLREMYPNLEKWRSIREELDPFNSYQSDLSRRIGLCGDNPKKNYENNREIS